MSENEFLLDIVEENDQKTKELHNRFAFIRNFSVACDHKKHNEIKKLAVKHRKTLKHEITSLLQEAGDAPDASLKQFKRRILDLTFSHFCERCQSNFDESLFFAAAAFDLIRLGELLQNITSRDLNQMKYCDSVINFTLKYGDVRNVKFFECLKLLITSGVDVNSLDFKGKTSIDHVAHLYEEYKDEEAVLNCIKSVASLILERGIYRPKKETEKTTDFLVGVLHLDMSRYTFCTMSDKDKLFNYIIKNKVNEFLHFKHLHKYLECDNGENTLLQFACKRTDKLLPIVKALLKEGADPNRTTKWAKLSPLELALLSRNQRIFEELLEDKRTKVTEAHYNHFVSWSFQSLKSKLFEIFLESEKLDPNFKCYKRGNTPLHYAIRFSHKNAIQQLLSREPSLLESNKIGICPIDLIDVFDLQTYLDSCLVFDNYTSYFSDLDYKMKFRFKSLIDDDKEVRIVSKIASRSNLEQLLAHPLIHAFISLKWFKMKIYFKVMLILQSLIFLPLSVFFYFLPVLSTVGRLSCVLIASFNFLIKLSIFVKWTTRHKSLKIRIHTSTLTTIRDSHFPAFTSSQVALHASLEILLAVTTMCSFFNEQFRAFVFVQMAISFLLTAGYHPRLSKWSVMLQAVFKTFTILLVFFSLIVLAFGIGFHVTFAQNGNSFFSNFLTSTFITYIMTVGEFNIMDLKLGSSGFAAYLLFLFFAMSMCLVIVNFTTGVAVTDIERIEKKAEINSFKNVIIFMSFVENYIYSLKFVRKSLPSPLLFSKYDKRYEVEFFVNKPQQFGAQAEFPTKIDENCVEKIKNHHDRMTKLGRKEQILLKLEEHQKILNEIKAKLYCKQNE